LIAEFSPGTSPPPVKTAMRFLAISTSFFGVRPYLVLHSISCGSKA
jgi:hypothetical protein